MSILSGSSWFITVSNASFCRSTAVEKGKRLQRWFWRASLGWLSGAANGVIAGNAQLRTVFGTDQAGSVAGQRGVNNSLGRQIGEPKMSA